MEPELIHYIRIFRKRFWLIILLAAVAGGGVYFYMGQQPLVYTARVRVLVGNAIRDPNPDFSQIELPVQLAATYQQLVRTYNVLQSTVETVDIEGFDVDELNRALSTRLVGDTPILDIIVTYTDRDQVAEIANTVADRLIRFSPTNLTESQQEQIEFLNSRIATLSENIDIWTTEIDAINVDLETTASTAERDRLIDRRSTLDDQIIRTQDIIARFSETVANIQSATNSLEIIEEARRPDEADSRGRLTTTILASIVGATLAVGLIFLLEYIDNAIRTPDESARLLGQPVLSMVVKYGKGDTAQRLIKQEQDTRVMRGYGTLQTNLLLAEQKATNGTNGANGHALNGKEEAKSTYIITSPNPGDGKTLTAINLGMSMASSGLRVLLIDADLVEPALHIIFNVKQNDTGLTTIADAMKNWVAATGKDKGELGETLRKSVHEVSPNLYLLPSGPIPRSTTQVLRDRTLRNSIDVLSTTLEADVILFDSPATLTTSASSVLATTMDASLVLVLQYGKTKRDQARRTVEQLTHVGGDIRGVVMNKVNPRNRSYTYGHGYFDTNFRTTSLMRAAQMGDFRATQELMAAEWDEVTNPSRPKRP